MYSFHISLLRVTFSLGTFSAYLLPPPHLVSQKSIYIFTLSPLLYSALSYNIMNYRVSFGYSLC